jgi:hypothetical protein
LNEACTICTPVAMPVVKSMGAANTLEAKIAAAQQLNRRIMSAPGIHKHMAIPREKTGHLFDQSRQELTCRTPQRVGHAGRDGCLIGIDFDDFCSGTGGERHKRSGRVHDSGSAHHQEHIGVPGCLFCIPPNFDGKTLAEPDDAWTQNSAARTLRRQLR